MEGDPLAPDRRPVLKKGSPAAVRSVTLSVANLADSPSSTAITTAKAPRHTAPLNQARDWELLGRGGAAAGMGLVRSFACGAVPVYVGYQAVPAAGVAVLLSGLPVNGVVARSAPRFPQSPARVLRRRVVRETGRDPFSRTHFCFHNPGGSESSHEPGSV